MTEPNLGMPLYWRHEQSGRMAEAVNAYLANRLERKPISKQDLDLMRGYLRQWILADGWNHCGEGIDEEANAILAELRRDVEHLTSADAIQKWLWRALEIGIDPL